MGVFRRLWNWIARKKAPGFTEQQLRLRVVLARAAEVRTQGTEKVMGIGQLAKSVSGGKINIRRWTEMNETERQRRRREEENRKRELAGLREYDADEFAQIFGDVAYAATTSDDSSPSCDTSSSDYSSSSSDSGGSCGSSD